MRQRGYPRSKVKLQTCIVIGGRKYLKADPAVEEYLTHNIWRLFDKYRVKYARHHGGDMHALYHPLRERMYRRILPIFKKALGEA